MYLALFIWTFRDLVGLIFWGGLITFFGVWLLWSAFKYWKDSPDRWWNRRR